MRGEQSIMAVIWEGKKLHLGLPLSFTKYKIEDGLLIERDGFINIREDQSQLYKVIDINMKKSILDALLKQGTIQVVFSNESDNIILTNVKNPEAVKKILNAEIDKSRQRQRVLAREDID